MTASEIVTEAHLQTLADGVYAWIGAGGDSNAGAVETRDSLIVIDAQQHAGLARQFRESLRRKIGKPVELVLNSHYHLDHLAGNAIFADEAPILAHTRTLEKLHALLGPDPGHGWTVTDLVTKVRLFYGPNTTDLVPDGDPAWDWFARRFAPSDYDRIDLRPPTCTFADTCEIPLPGDVLRCTYRGPAHCDGDLVFHVPGRKVAFLADLLFYGRFPWLGDSDLDGWIRTLEHVLTLDLEVVVPGHGVPVTLKEVAAFRDLLQALRDAVADAVARGASEEAAVREVRLPAYQKMSRYNEWLGFNVRNAYRYLKGG